MIQDNIGLFIRYLLYHYKSIEIRLENSIAVKELRQNDKHKIKLSLQKVKIAIDDVIKMTQNQEVIDALQKELNGVDLVYYMTLTEQLFDLNSDCLYDITNLIDDYLEKKLLKEQNIENGNTLSTTSSKDSEGGNT